MSSETETLSEKLEEELEDAKYKKTKRKLRKSIKFYRPKANLFELECPLCGEELLHKDYNVYECTNSKCRSWEGKDELAELFKLQEEVA